VLLAVGLGYLATNLLAPQANPSHAAARHRSSAERAEVSSEDSGTTTDLDGLMTGATR